MLLEPGGGARAPVADERNAGTERLDVRSRRPDLGNLLATEDAAEMAQPDDHCRPLRPLVRKAHGRAVRGEYLRRGERTCVHGATYSTWLRCDPVPTCRPPQQRSSRVSRSTSFVLSPAVVRGSS